MRSYYQRLFIGLSIVIVYCVAVSELIYTKQFIAWMDSLETKWDKDFYRIENKYRIAIGDENPAGETAVDHFRQNMIPKIFHTCADGFYTIYQTTQSTYRPPKYKKWYDPLYKTGTYSYNTVYKILGFSDLEYQQEIHKQTDTEILVELKLSGKAMVDDTRYEIGIFTVRLDYDLTVTKVEGTRDTAELPVVGHGKMPHSFGCEYLQANNNKFLNR